MNEYILGRLKTDAVHFWRVQTTKHNCNIRG
jgi:hypothetical protein